MGEFGLAEAEASCPVSLDVLGQLYRSDKSSVVEMLKDFPEDKRARLALFCYNRSHLRDLALAIAETCDASRLAELAGTLGQVLAAQCRGHLQNFGRESAPIGHSRAKISLASVRG
jgi:hypothetical protein